MVRGNWQKRVEIAEARRRDTKQRKQRNEDKRHFKCWVNECLTLLDRYGRRPLRVHLWTDTMASDSPPLLDIVHLDDSGGSNKAKAKRQMRARSLSGENHDAVTSTPGGRTTRQGGRARSDSTTESTSMKKMHPRSAPATPSAHELEREATALLCKSHFFFCKCEEPARRKIGCRYIHYSSQYQTLASVLSSNLKRSSAVLQQIKLAEQAAVLLDSDDQDQNDAMDMVYYSCVELKQPVDASSEPLQSLSEELTDALAEMHIKLGSVVYIVVNDCLIFDRYREGIFLNDQEFLFALTGHQGHQEVLSRGTRLSVGNEDECCMEVELVTKLPGSILENILTFLPDASVASTCEVCKDWNREIGRSSPNLWKHLLDRHHWPIPSQPNENEDPTNAFRAAFLQHYAAVRDLKAIQHGLSAIANKQTVEEKEMAYQDFSTRKNAPSQSTSGECVSLQVWSPNHVLVGYSRDCSIRLFETVPRGGRGDGLLCRERVCRRVDPYINTKRRSCVMLSMVVDEESICCLCHVMADTLDVEAYVLVVLSRDDFLVGCSDTMRAHQDCGLHVIDIGESVLNFLLSSDVVDHRLLLLMDFLSSDSGKIGDVEVLVSRTMTACGYGRFLIEVSISIPSIDRLFVDDTVPMLLVDRKLVLFSVRAGAIVWMGDSNDIAVPLPPRHEDMALSSLARRTFQGAPRAACSVMVTSPTSATAMAVTIGPTGRVESERHLHEPGTFRANIFSDGWDVASPPQRVIMLLSSDFVSAEVFQRIENDRIIDRKSVVFFYPRFPSVHESSFEAITFESGVEVERLSSLGENHIVMLCREYHRSTVDQHVNAPHEENAEQSFQMSVLAILIHVESRTEVHRLTLLHSVVPALFQLPEISVVDETIGVVLSWKGILMTGNSIRSAARPDIILLDGAAANRGTKKKKKKVVSRSNKKDGFARGMSLRG